MKTRIATILLAAAALAIVALPHAQAQSPHFVASSPAVFTDLGTTLQVTGTVAGLGQEPLEITVVADAVAKVECFNPGESTGPVPGQSKTLTVEGSTGEVTPNRQGMFILRAGTLTTDPVTVTGAEACPNRQWEAEVTDVTFSNVQVFVEQSLGSEPVLIASFPGTV